MVQTYKLEDKLNETNLVHSWEKIMGTVVARRTTKLFISKRKLFVSLSSAPLRDELMQSRDKIAGRLNEEAGSVVIDEIIFQ